MEEPETGFSDQLTWTRLPQGFKNSPILFDEALHQDLADFWIHNPNVVLLQYVDDLLLGAETEQDCLQCTGPYCKSLENWGTGHQQRRPNSVKNRSPIWDTGSREVRDDSCVPKHEN